MSKYDTLNEEQKKACFHTEGPVLILAGAGSGKTRVITHRIAYLMEECSVSPWNILAITFTNKAAGEMRERVDRLIGFGSQSVWISTFHSLCVRILRRHIDAIGYDPHFTIYDADDQKAVVKRVCRTLNVDTKQFRERSLLSAISHAKNELVSVEQYQELHKASRFEEVVGRVYEEYEKELQKNGALDFDDLLLKTVELFSRNREILENYQERFRYIMVDEYQDTNRVQFELVNQLAKAHRNLCVVGDDDQSIYKFRGADIRNILDFEKQFPDAFVVRLEQNYRSTQNILDAANAVIANNTDRKKKRLWTDQGKGTKVHLREFESSQDEASYIAWDIQEKCKENPHLSYKDFAVLYRTNAQSRILGDQFVLSSVPYNIVGGQNFYDRMEVRDIISYLRTIDNAQDDLSVERIINVPRRGIGKTTIERVQEIAAKKETGFFQVLEQLNSYPELERASKKIRPFVDLILDLHTYAQDHSVVELIEKIIADIDYEDYLKDYDEETWEDRIGNVNELISKAASWEEDVLQEEDADATLFGFLEEISLVADIDQVGEEDNRVLLMTLHSAKGLEFSHVYIAGMEDGLFPGEASIVSLNPADMEEERRLAYVGITRAKDDLTLTCAQTRMVRGEVQYHTISRFVQEIPESLLDETMPQGRRRERDYSSPRYGYDTGFKTNLRTQEEKKSTFGKEAAFAQETPKRTARPRATYVRPHTSEEARPHLAAKTGLDTLTKGSPKSSRLDYTEGDRVQHVKYGTGTVLSIEKGLKDFKVKVHFDEAGDKVMYAAFAKLKKVE